MHRVSAKDFFLHLGAIVALYTVTISFINLVFKITNKAFPEVAQNVYAWGASSEISLPVATLIVVFPIFIILSYFVYKTYAENPEKKELAVRKWLIYVTLFVAGILLVGDLVAVLYKFLDGQDLTAAFLLKALALLAVSGYVFGFYLQDLREKISGRKRKLAAIGSAAIILIFIIAGFSVLGSPKTQRLLRLDNQKITDLQNLEWQVINYWQTNGMIPDLLPNISADQQTGTPYEYKKTGGMEFELCAVFNAENEAAPNTKTPSAVYPGGMGMPINENWNHSIGHQCFSRTIDPIVFPTQVKG